MSLATEALLLADDGAVLRRGFLKEGLVAVVRPLTTSQQIEVELSDNVRDCTIVDRLRMVDIVRDGVDKAIADAAWRARNALDGGDLT